MGEVESTVFISVQPRGTAMRLPGAKLTVGIMVALVVMCLALNAGRFLISGDFFWDVALSHALGHDTRYAAGYSEGKWSGLRRGMTTSEVESAMGQPLKKVLSPGGQEV